MWGGNVRESEGFQGGLLYTQTILLRDSLVIYYSHSSHHILLALISCFSIFLLLNYPYDLLSLVSTTLQSTTFPFLAIIALQYPASGSGSSINMSVVDRLEGPTTADAIVRRLESAVQRHGPPLERVRRERQEREHDRMLRDQQDLAYRESLRADQEKV